MGVQFGILARLTWWEYSWDIMEPVTYFVTYGTAMATYAYYVLTKQVTDIFYWLSFFFSYFRVIPDVISSNEEYAIMFYFSCSYCQDPFTRSFGDQ